MFLEHLENNDPELRQMSVQSLNKNVSPFLERDFPINKTTPSNGRATRRGAHVKKTTDDDEPM